MKKRNISKLFIGMNMRTAVSIIVIILSVFMAQAENKLYITANGVTKTATLESNSSVEEFKKLLPLTIQMSDYGGWEKVGDLPHSITRDDHQTTARPGDIILYQGRSIVIFYGDNTWAYTKLGKLDDSATSVVKEFLNGSSVEVTFALSESSAVECVRDHKDQEHEIYDLSGRRIPANSLNNLPHGLYIIDGKKTLIK